MENGAKVAPTETTDNESESMRSVVAANISAYRQKLKLTRGELAAKIGATEAAIGQYERGVRTPQLEYLCKLADVFNITIDLLVEHGKSEYDSVKEYRFDRVLNFVRRLGYSIYLLTDGTIKIVNLNKKPVYNFSNGIVNVEESNSTTELLMFKNREAFVIFFEDLILKFLSARGIRGIVDDIILNLNKRNKIIVPKIYMTTDNSQDELPI